MAVDLWSKGNLHVILAAPKKDYAWRMTIAPNSTTTGPQIGIILSWAGADLNKFEALRRGMQGADPLGVLHQLFNISSVAAPPRPWGPGVQFPPPATPLPPSCDAPVATPRATTRGRSRLRRSAVVF